MALKLELVEPDDEEESPTNNSGQLSDDGGGGTGGAAARATGEPSEDSTEPFENYPLIKKALQIFQGEIRSVKPSN